LEEFIFPSSWQEVGHCRDSKNFQRRVDNLEAGVLIKARCEGEGDRGYLINSDSRKGASLIYVKKKKRIVEVKVMDSLWQLKTVKEFFVRRRC
jgi:hypothetical protein